MTGLCSLPDELLQHIAGGCMIRDAGRLSLVNKKFSALVTGQMLRDKCTPDGLWLAVGTDRRVNYPLPWSCLLYCPDGVGTVPDSCFWGLLHAQASCPNTTYITAPCKDFMIVDQRDTGIERIFVGSLERLEEATLLQQSVLTRIVYQTTIDQNGRDKRALIAVAKYCSVHTCTMNEDVGMATVADAISFKASADAAFCFLPTDVQSAWPECVCPRDKAERRLQQCSVERHLPCLSRCTLVQLGNLARSILLRAPLNKACVHEVSTIVDVLVAVFIKDEYHNSLPKYTSSTVKAIKKLLS